MADGWWNKVELIDSLFNLLDSVDTLSSVNFLLEIQLPFIFNKNSSCFLLHEWVLVSHFVL
jgi:hypothetical protein